MITSQENTMEPTHDEWISLPDEDAREGVFEVQTESGERIAHVYGSTPDEAEARADQIASVPELLAYAECQEAYDCFVSGPTGTAELLAVLDRHGWVEHSPSIREFLEGLRRSALAKARPVPVGAINSPEMVP
jgi:hypothetical protein